MGPIRKTPVRFIQKETGSQMNIFRHNRAKKVQPFLTQTFFPGYEIVGNMYSYHCLVESASNYRNKDTKRARFSQVRSSQLCYALQ